METRARKRTIVQKLQVSQMYNQKPLYAGSSYNIEGGLHMSCHYQPLIVPSQHFSIYSDSSVPSGRYAWMVNKAGTTLRCVFKPLFVVCDFFICDDYF